jgi:4-phospho-D-threonate 3-dehydrogenase / 4-phospho-D-erythronate 3-dehydrogenase
MRPLLALCMGDHNGIGPEVVLKSAPHLPAGSRVHGSRRVFERLSADLGLALRSDISWLDTAPLQETDIRYGVPDAISGEAAMACVRAAVLDCVEGRASAMITAPLSKEAIAMAGYPFPGHTEYLRELTGSTDVGMLLVGPDLRVGLVTIHQPLATVSESLNPEAVLRRIRMLRSTLRNDFGIPTPRIAVLGLNPHAGDGGVLGHEEERVIVPAIRAAVEDGIDASGPYPADGFFGSRAYRRFDAVLAMYHDQGLIPFKTLSFHDGVNVTVGLPIIRTSPDHGTAYDIAGTGQADPASMISAITCACTIYRHRYDASYA